MQLKLSVHCSLPGSFSLLFSPQNNHFLVSGTYHFHVCFYNFLMYAFIKYMIIILQVSKLHINGFMLHVSSATWLCSVICFWDLFKLIYAALFLYFDFYVLSKIWIYQFLIYFPVDWYLGISNFSLIITHVFLCK